MGHRKSVFKPFENSRSCDVILTKFATIANMQVLQKVLDIKKEPAFGETFLGIRSCAQDLENAKTCKEPIILKQPNKEFKENLQNP